jgi:FAD-NAD(P)-binding
MSFKFGIVGGGPNALYLLERILSHVRARHRVGGLEVYVFDRAGAFGFGCHAVDQVPTNHLNRVAAQISFGADASHGTEVANSNSPGTSETLFTWCKARYEESLDERYRVGERSWVSRSLFGEASSAVFSKYVVELRTRGVPVSLLVAEVVDVAPDSSGRMQIVTSNGNGALSTISADFVALCTGHGTRKPDGRWAAALRHGVCKPTGAIYVDQAYPLEQLGVERVRPGVRVALIGMGLAAIDVILRLTEGRGGYFARTGDNLARLEYRRSSSEPRLITPFSATGVFLFVRAHNQKLNDQSLFHRGVFFTRDNLDALRDSRGVAGLPGTGTRKQLDFEMHVLPLMVLETAYVHSKTLFGATAGVAFRKAADGRVQQFLADRELRLESPEEAREWVLRFPQQVMQGIAHGVRRVVLEYEESVDAAEESYALAFLRFRYGAGRLDALRASQGHEIARCLRNVESPWSHAADPFAHLFDWETFIDPLRNKMTGTTEELRASGLAWLERDLQDARQGNIDNPRKAAIDGVWRDLRDTLRYAVEHGGLTAESHAVFSDEFCRMVNRIAVGTSLGVMEKIESLARSGILDLAWARAPNVVDSAHGGFDLCRERFGTTEPYQVLINARVHRFKVDGMNSPLFDNLLLRGLIRPWLNRGRNGFVFAPGGIDIAHPTHLAIGEDGRPNLRLAVLGPPTEGPLYFHIAAARPFCNDPVIIDADRVVSHALSLVQGDLDEADQYGDAQLTQEHGHRAMRGEPSSSSANS